MKLYSHPASPFARKARIIAHELGLKLEEINVSPSGSADLRKLNPLGKVPALVLDDGSALFDSPVICEYLNEKGGGKFFPGMSLFRNTSGRWRALGLQALADGICDAAVACSGERRLPEEKRNADVMVRHLAAINAGLDALERGATRFAENPTIGEISIGCTLGYLDFRFADLEWRATRPRLRDWYQRFAQYPSMVVTAPANLA